MSEPALPPRLEAELERLRIDDEYDFLTVTIRLGDGRRFTLDFSRDSELARDVLEAVAERLRPPPRARRRRGAADALLRAAVGGGRLGP